MRNLLFLIFIIILTSCKKDVGKVNFGDYPNEIGLIMTTKCAVSGCHNNESYKGAASLNLSTWQDLFKGSSNGLSVIPFNSKFSYLCYYINTYPELGTVNEPTMPINGKALTKDEVKLFFDWIDRGAPDGNGNVMWADNPNLKKLYVVNQGCDVVTVIDSETQLPIRYIEVGNKPGAPDTPHSLRVSPDGKYWYVVFINNNIMQKYRCSDDSYVGDIPLSPKAAGINPSVDGFDWNTLIISDDGTKAYAVSWTQSGRVAAVDLENRKLLHYLPNLNYPHGVALNATNDTLYVTAQTGNYISAIDTGFTVKNDYSLEPSQPVSQLSSLDIHDIILTPDGNNLIVTCQKTNDMRKFNLQTHQVSIAQTGAYPQEIAYSKNTNQYFASCPYDSTMFPGTMGLISKTDADFTSVSHLPVGFQPHGIGVDENKNLLYVVSRNLQTNGPAPHHTSQCGNRNGFINFIDIPSWKLLSKKYELSADPYFVFSRP
ncbi:MAG: YncE family protein [Bacteroidia bacterium]